MAKRGRPKTALKILKARGSRVSKKREDQEKARSNEPDYKRPRPPRWLGHWAKIEWRRLCPILEKWGILSELDRDTLGQYCAEAVMYARLQSEVDLMKNDELMLTSSNGSKYPSPWLGARNQSGKRLISLAAVLGLTPLAREGLLIEPKVSKEPSGKERFFGKKFGTGRNDPA